MTDAHYCPSCGQPVALQDRFCRGCGLPLESEHAAAASGAGAPTLNAGPRRRGRRVAIAGASLIALAAFATALVLMAGGAFSGDQTSASAQQSQSQARLAAERRRVKPQFDELMRHRDRLFETERRYLAAIGDAQGEIRDYRRAERDYRKENKRIQEEFADEFDECYRFDIACPHPDYPDAPKVPSLSAQTSKLRLSGDALVELRAQLASVTPRAELAVVHTQLLAAADALRSEASHNADVLDEATEPAEGEGTGFLNKGKIKTLHTGEALPAIRQLNRAAVQVIERLRVPRSGYDLPGGRDVDSADHSDET